MPKSATTYDSPLMQFVVDYLRAVKNAPYKDIAAAAAKKGLKLVPIVYGRARAALGMAKKTKPATPGRRPGRPKGSKNKAGGRGPGRPAGTAAPGSMDAVIAYVRGLERDVAGLRARMAKIAGLTGG